MKKLLILPVFAGISLAFGQEIASLPIEDLVAKQDQAILNEQGNAIFRSLDPIGSPYAQSTVAIVAGNRQVASGMIVAPGKVISKYSDLIRWRVPLAVIDSNSKVHDMRVMGALPEHDLILLNVPGLELPPVDFNNLADVQEGSLIFTVSPEGKATDFGVISVDQRSLRDEDQPYIGIMADPRWRGKGARIFKVEPESPAFLSGVLRGDIIEKINGKTVDGLFSMRTALNGVKPGDKVEIVVKRGKQQTKEEITAGSRPAMHTFSPERLRKMNEMGNRMSKRTDNFPLVYQSDMTLLPERAGSPVVDLNGKLVGMALSRAGRIETYILPAWALKELTDQAISELENKDVPIAEPAE